MKYIFFFLVAINLTLFAMGQGWFGPPRSELGRNPAMLQQQLNANQVTVTPNTAR